MSKKTKKQDQKVERVKTHDIMAIRVEKNGVIYLQMTSDLSKKELQREKGDPMVARDPLPLLPHQRGISPRIQGTNNGPVSRYWLRRMHIESRTEHPDYKLLVKNRQEEPDLGDFNG